MNQELQLDYELEEEPNNEPSTAFGSFPPVKEDSAVRTFTEQEVLHCSICNEPLTTTTHIF